MSRRLLPALGLLGLVGGACLSLPEEPEDRPYLVAFCTSFDTFTDATAASSASEDVRSALRTFADQLERSIPPEDAAEFNRAYVAFLRQAAGAQAGADLGEPPVPPKAVRRRFQGIEPDVPACDAATPFGS